MPPEQKADELLALAIIQERRYLGKLGELALTLRMGSNTRPYGPARTLLEVILSMYELTNKSGRFELRYPDKFTPANQRVTSAKELIRLARKRHVILTEKTITRALKVLADGKLIFRTKGRWKKTRSVIFVKFNVGVLWQRMGMPGTLPKTAAAPYIRHFPVALHNEKGSNNNPGNPGFQTDRSVRFINIDCTSSAPGNAAATPQSIAGNVPDDCNHIHEEGVAGFAGGLLARETNKPLADLSPAPGTMEFTLSHQQAQVVDFAATSPVFLDSCGNHSPARLTAQDVQQLISAKVTLTELKRYFGAIHSLPGQAIHDTCEKWWTRMTVDSYCKFRRVILRELNKDQAEHALFEFNPTGFDPGDLDSIYQQTMGRLMEFAAKVGFYAADKAAALWLYLVQDKREPDPDFSRDAVILANLLKADLDALDQSLFGAIVQRHRVMARYVIMEQCPLVLLALKHAQHDVEEWFGLSDNDIQRATTLAHALQTDHLVQTRMLQHQMNGG